MTTKQDARNIYRLFNVNEKPKADFHRWTMAIASLMNSAARSDARSAKEALCKESNRVPGMQSAPRVTVPA